MVKITVMKATTTDEIMINNLNRLRLSFSSTSERYFLAAIRKVSGLSPDFSGFTNKIAFSKYSPSGLFISITRLFTPFITIFTTLFLSSFDMDILALKNGVYTKSSRYFTKNPVKMLKTMLKKG